MTEKKHQTVGEFIKTKQALLLLSFSVLVFFCILVLPKITGSEYETIEQKMKKGEFNVSEIDSLRSNMTKVKKAAGLSDIAAKYDKVKKKTVAYKQTQEEIRAELLGAVNPKDQIDFEKELDTTFDVGAHKGFFVRQIENCKSTLDLAVVGMGIIRVDEVMRGENPTVKTNDKAEFITYIKEQVLYAVSAEDKNYKALVFKGIESSGG